MTDYVPTFLRWFGDVDRDELRVMGGGTTGGERTTYLVFYLGDGDGEVRVTSKNEAMLMDLLEYLRVFMEAEAPLRRIRELSEAFAGKWYPKPERREPR